MGTTKMENITTQYRSFVPDQVLTAKQLNTIIDYFEGQNRLTRICLSGVGVVCGLDINYIANTSITISRGCGVTTDADLVRYKERELPYTHFKPFKDRADYSKFTTIHDIVELVTTEELTDAQPLSSLTNITNKVVVLYLENYAKEETPCSSIDCDTQGKEQVAKIRILLFNKTDVENSLNSSDTIYTKHNIYESFTQLSQIAVQKVILKGGLGSGNNIQSYTKLATSYKSAITNSKSDLHTSFSTLLNSFSDLLSIESDTRDDILNRINDLDNFTLFFGVQYRYDLAKDIIDTYNEIVDLLLKLKTECCPDIESFPKHLLLGSLSSTQAYPELRHEFYHSPLNNCYDTYLKMAKSLIQRVILLLNKFTLIEEGRIVITPSKRCALLGSKAIPFYYTVDNSLLQVWDFYKTQNYKYQYNLSFHKEYLASDNWVQNPLQYDLDCSDFYRIEGHLGLPGLESRDEIIDYKDNNGLDFDCTVFDIETDAQSLTKFVKDNPSTNHSAGVSKGGTYILLTEKEVVVADFNLSYKIPPATNKQECCSLIECTYPWISSLKYLNNLSRSLKGTQSRNKPMPQNYILQVVEYQINGERLINNTTTITIPLKEIFLRRIHAITEALNKRFDKGVVFDFNESQKRLVITRAKEDNYVIRLRDNTVANNPIYTYSNNGMFRNNKVFRQDAMRCRDLKSYNPSFYQKLQNEIAPVNKDDDYGTFDEKWKKWTTLRDRLQYHFIYTQADTPRFITDKNELPNKIKDTISKIRRDLTDSRLSTNLYLDGDWVNGRWIDDTMLDFYRDNKKNTHDDMVLFIELRKYLHKKTGISKLSIYIPDDNYNNNYDPIIKEYSTSADFYFGMPSGENAIKI